MLVSLLKHLYLSCTNLEWYAFLHTISLKKHLITFITALFIASCVLSVRLALVETPRVMSNIDTVYQATLSHYPDSLIIQWHNNTLTMNQQSLTVSVPDLLAVKNIYTTETVFLSSEQLDKQVIEKLLSDHTYVIDKTNLYFHANGTVNTLSLKELITVDSFYLTKQSVQSLGTNTLHSINSSRIWIPLLLPWILFPFLLISRVISLIIDSILIYILLRLIHNTFYYKHIFLLTLNAMIPSEILYQLSHLYMYDLSIPLYTVVFWVYITVTIVYISLKKTTSIQTR